MLEKHRKRVLKDSMWRKIAKTLPLKGKELGEAMIALKTRLVWSNGKPEILNKVDNSVEKIPALEDSIVDEELLPWVQQHWKDALWVERARNR